MALRILLSRPAIVNEELSLERINEIKSRDNFKNIVYYTNLMNNTNLTYEEKKRSFKNIMGSIINERELLLINKNFRNITIRKINEFISDGVFDEDEEFIRLREEINKILISITV